MGNPHPQPAGRERRTGRRLFGLLRPHRRTIVVALLCILFASIINGMLPFLVITTAHTPMAASGDAAKGDGLDSKLDLFRRIGSRFADVGHQPIAFIIVTVIV